MWVACTLNGNEWKVRAKKCIRCQEKYHQPKGPFTYGEMTFAQMHKQVNQHFVLIPRNVYSLSMIGIVCGIGTEHTNVSLVLNGNKSSFPFEACSFEDAIQTPCAL